MQGPQNRVANSNSEPGLLAPDTSGTYQASVYNVSLEGSV